MIQDEYGQVILNEDDLVDLIMKGRSYQSFEGILVDDTVDAELFNCCKYQPTNITVRDFDTKAQSTWFMPKQYQDIDIVQFVLDKCSNNAELDRCGKELVEYQRRNLLNLLRYLVYLVDTMKSNNVIWGVGRGSSVSSFVLYLIGIHRVNSLQYELPFEDFMR
jgi:hypothetical protein